MPKPGFVGFSKNGGGYMNINSFGVGKSTAQYDGFCTGGFGTSVNLFRGEAFFDYPLVNGLPEKNGIGIKVLAAYSSNTDYVARKDNISEPTGVLGLGWKFGYPSIIRADTGQILPPEQEIFYYNNTEGISRLYQTKYPWIIAELDSEVQQELDKQQISGTLSGIFAENGIAVTTGSKLYKEDGYYILEDCIEEIELKIEKNENGKFDVSYNGVFLNHQVLIFHVLYIIYVLKSGLQPRKMELRKYLEEREAMGHSSILYIAMEA